MWVAIPLTSTKRLESLLAVEVGRSIGVEAKEAHRGLQELVEPITECRYSGFNDLFKGCPQYDSLIEYWVEWYDLGVPWYWVKAQLIQESALNRKAVSYMGAKGLGQFMPLTWKDMERQLWNGKETDVFNPVYNIQATVYYNKWLMSQWRADGRSIEERWALTLASYNAGLGNVLKAQRKASSNRYREMEAQLHSITGKANSNQTKQYVERITLFRRRLEDELGGGDG